MIDWGSCRESDSLLLPEDFGEALLICQILFCRVRFSPSTSIARQRHAPRQRRHAPRQLRCAEVRVEPTEEADDLLRQATHIDAIAEEMRIAGRPLHEEFAAEAMRRRALAQQMLEAADVS